MTPKQELTVRKTIYKVWRESTKLEHLKKNAEAEQINGLKAKELFGYGIGWKTREPNSATDWKGYPVINLKSIKMVFNYAYRLKNSDPTTAIAVYQDLIV